MAEKNPDESPDVLDFGGQHSDNHNFVTGNGTIHDESNAITSILQGKRSDSPSFISVNYRQHDSEDRRKLTTTHNNDSKQSLLYLEQLKKENAELKRKMKCFMCNKFNFAFVNKPCGHLICTECTTTRVCICGKLVEGRNVAILPPITGQTFKNFA